MANTKGLPRPMRKGVKRSQRKKLKALYGSLTPSERKKFNDPEENVGLKAFIAAKAAK